MTTKKAVKKVEEKPELSPAGKNIVKNVILESVVSTLIDENQTLKREIQMVKFFTGWDIVRRDEEEQRGVGELLAGIQEIYNRELLKLNLTKAFALFTAGMLAGAVIMKFL